MSDKNGSYFLKLLLIALTGVASIASTAKPAVLPPVPTPSGDLTMVLLSDKLIGPLILGNIVQLIIYLWKSIKASEKKQLEEISKLVSHIPQIVTRLDQIDHHIEHKVPTRDHVEVMIFKEVRDQLRETKQ